MPLFSIIIATLNAEKTIRRCLASLVKQRCKDFEIRIVDGKSTDTTLQRIAEFSALPLHVTSEPDKGLYDALNKGIRAAQGRWINILGADDALLPHALTAVHNAAARETADIHAGYARIVGDGPAKTLRADVCDCRTLVGNVPFCHNAMFASREAYDAVGLYDLSYRVAADAQWMHRAVRAGMRFHIIETPLVRFSAGGISGNAALTMPECYRLIRENFPCLNEAEAKDLLFMAKGWEDGSKLEAILARHPSETALAKAALAAREYAPYCAQRRLERESAQQPFWRKALQKAVRLFT